MPNYLLSNNAISTLAAPITTGATTLTVNAGDGAKFPSGATANMPFPLVVRAATYPLPASYEIMLCTGRSGDTLTVVRAQEGTTVFAFSAGDIVELDLTAGVVNSLTTGISSVANLRLVSGQTTGQVVTLTGYASQNDGGQGQFQWGAYATDNGGTIITPTGQSAGSWYRIFSGSFNVKWFGAKGDGVTNDTAAINAANTALNIVYQQYGQTTSNQQTLLFPAGIYTVTPGGLNFIQAGIDGENAVFQPSADADGAILTIQQPLRMGKVKIRGIMGFSCGGLLATQNPIPDSHTKGIYLTNCAAAHIDVGIIVGLNVGVFLDSYAGSVNNPTSDNIFNIDRVWWNTIGIVQRCGTLDASGRSESNQFNINYMVGNAVYHVWLDATTNVGTASIQNNHYTINTLELGYAANEIGLYLTGSATGCFNNQFDVLSKTDPTGTGALIEIGSATNNIFNIPYEAIGNYAGIIEMGNGTNIYKNVVASVVYGTAAPTVGRWNVGDIVWNTAPTASGVPGWVCVVAGTPGTWNAMANLAATAASSAPAMVSGTIYQNTSSSPMTLYVPITYIPTSGAAATCAVALGSGASPSTIFTSSRPAGSQLLDNEVVTETVRIPSLWYYSFTVTNATIGTVTAVTGS